jgi:hypothetical protein
MVQKAFGDNGGDVFLLNVSWNKIGVEFEWWNVFKLKQVRILPKISNVISHGFFL